MPDEGVRRCRAAWARLASRPKSVVHGDPNPRNILIAATDPYSGSEARRSLINAGQVGLVDWDEAHVDASDLDLVLPDNAANLDPISLDIAFQASAAWEAAVCWDDAYARRRLSEVRDIETE